MERGIDIYGTHVGGGWGSTPEEDGAAGIYYAVGRLSGSELTIVGARRCDDRAELLEWITQLGGPWGLDFPFALPAWTYQTFSNRDWPALLDFADTFEEAQVRDRTGAAGLDDSRRSAGVTTRLVVPVIFRRGPSLATIAESFRQRFCSRLLYTAREKLRARLGIGRCG